MRRSPTWYLSPGPLECRNCLLLSWVMTRHGLETSICTGMRQSSRTATVSQSARCCNSHGRTIQGATCSFKLALLLLMHRVIDLQSANPLR